MTDAELREQIKQKLLEGWTDKTSATVADEIMQLITARDAAIRIDQMTEDLGISKASIAVNREELITELRRESDPKS